MRVPQRRAWEGKAQEARKGVPEFYLGTGKSAEPPPVEFRAWDQLV